MAISKFKISIFQFQLVKVDQNEKLADHQQKQERETCLNRARAQTGRIGI